MSKKWKAFLRWDNTKKTYFVLLYHYHHLVWVYDMFNRQELYEWWERPTDKRGLDSARIWMKARHKKVDSLGKPITKCNKEV